MAAWPGLGELQLGRWVVRHGGGHTRRCNAIAVLAPEADPAPLLAEGEAFLLANGVPPLLRVVDYAGVDPGVFDAAGYGPAFDTTVTLACPLDSASFTTEGVEILVGAPGEEWLDAKDRLNGDSAADQAARRPLLERIGLPIAYGGVRGPDGAYASVAYMALDGKVASLNMVVTDPALLGRRLAEQGCGALAAWAKAEGARIACLQTMEENTPARRLYARLGYGEPVYRYAYRAKASSG